MAPEQELDSETSRQRLTIDNDIYELVSTTVISRVQQSRVSKYNDPEHEYMKPYSPQELVFPVEFIGEGVKVTEETDEFACNSKSLTQFSRCCN